MLAPSKSPCPARHTVEKGDGVRYERLYVAGTGLHLPAAVAAEAAVDAGLCDPRAVRRMRMRSVCVSDAESGPEMAVHAARAALRQAGTRPDHIGLVLHACTYHQGHDLWAPASYVQRMAVGNACLSVEVRQLSNGGMAAMELAAAHLSAHPDRHSALVTTGDRFCPPGFDRWNTDPGTVCGDGGTAMVLSTRGGFARVRSLVTVSDPELEHMGRGADPFSDAPLGARSPISIETHRTALAKEFGMNELLKRLTVGQLEAYEQALADAETAATAVDRFVLPNLGHPKMDFQFFRALGIEERRTTWTWGSGIGHLGAGDQIAGLTHLMDTGALPPGATCVLLGAGAGFSWSAAVLDIVDTPVPHDTAW
ncbi:ketoacyl-ACP synthase III family protein [Streptomyces sp. NPDC053542]|uniref:ketoacyl-ACP synthase III family protein n=1 Tax=Streptomyces sp. NPDC053542 TaxID=3365710 RepID=UPI0037D4D8C6